jgi:hypothetical protein
MSRVRIYIVIFFSRQLFWLSLCRAEWLLSSPNSVPQVRATSRAWANIRRKQSARIVRPSSRRSGGPRDRVKRLEKKKNRRTRCWGESTCFDRNASNNCDPHCLFLAPIVWMCKSLMYCGNNFQDTLNIAKVSTIASSCAWVPFFFFEWHEFSAGHCALFLHKMQWMTLWMDFGVQVHGSMGNCQMILRPSSYLCVYSTVSIITIYFDFEHWLLRLNVMLCVAFF